MPTLDELTLARAREMRDGKRGPEEVTESLVEEDFALTYVPSGNPGAGQVASFTKLIRRGDGSVWQRVSTFSYDSADNMTGKTDVLTLLVPSP